jgi:ABC-type glutathione transport system ATPase component
MRKKVKDVPVFDYVEKRQKMLFEEFAAPREEGTRDQGLGTRESDSDNGIASGLHPDILNNNPQSPVPSPQSPSSSPLPTPHSPLPILTIRNVSNIYISRSFGLFGKKEIKPVLNNVNLDIAEGEIVGLTGESGCGKTTLARCILGLIDYRGEIIINGPVQMIFQDPGASLNPAIKIGRLMEEPLVIRCKDNHSTARQRSLKVDETLARVGLDPSYKTRRVHELSGGQKQRVCIARALITSSKILIADEAASSLDVSAGAQILNLFRELRQTLALTVLFISHSTDAVEYLRDRVVVMKNGVTEPLTP